MATDLTYQGLASGIADGSQPHLNLRTQSGRIRQVPLTRRDLVKMIQQAGSALEVLDRAEERAAR